MAIEEKKTTSVKVEFKANGFEFIINRHNPYGSDTQPGLITHRFDEVMSWLLAEQTRNLRIDAEVAAKAKKENANDDI